MRVLRGHPLRQAVGFGAWIVAVAVAFDFGVFSLPTGPWLGVVLQVAGYLLDIAPIVFAATTRLYPHALAENIVSFTATGICEELSLRGFIWERTRLAGLRPLPLIAINVVAFTAWHLVSVASGNTGWSDLIGIACFGTLVSIVRQLTGGSAADAAAHRN